jgi:hypothetical protein
MFWCYFWRMHFIFLYFVFILCYYDIESSDGMDEWWIKKKISKAAVWA